MSERYAIFYTPATSSPLWRRAAQWLGRDASGAEPDAGEIAGLAPERRMDLTTSARRYGFHATIKPPMTLPGHKSVGDLETELTTFALARSAIPIGRLEVRLLGDFLALMPVDPPAALGAFAADVVQSFEPFRAPISAGDRDRRMEAGLSPRQVELLDRYGYPYVLDQFQFHMTIADRLTDNDRDLVVKAARAWFAPVLEEPVTIDRLTLFHEPREQAAFVRLGDFPLLSEVRV